MEATRNDARRGRPGLALAAPAAAALAGIAAEWLDFRALRWPILALMVAGAAATTGAVAGGRGGWRAFGIAVVTGVLAWALAQCVYVIIHVARGGVFDVSRGPEAQWAQALVLIAAHGVALGLPTGVAAGVLLQGFGVWQGRSRS